MLGYALLGPLVGAIVSAGGKHIIVEQAGLLTLSGIGLVVAGVGTAAMVVPSQPEMLLDVPESNEADIVAVTSLWNGMFLGGAGSGSLVSGLMFISFLGGGSLDLETTSVTARELTTQALPAVCCITIAVALAGGALLVAALLTSVASSTITHMDAPSLVAAAKDRAPSPELDVYEGAEKKFEIFFRTRSQMPFR